VFNYTHSKISIKYSTTATGDDQAILIYSLPNTFNYNLKILVDKKQPITEENVPQDGIFNEGKKLFADKNTKTVIVKHFEDSGFYVSKKRMDCLFK